MPRPSKTKALLIDLLLAASANKDGLSDVITGRGDALEPLFDEEGTVTALQFGIGAMVLWAVEDTDEKPIVLIFGDTYYEAYVLVQGIGEARRYVQTNWPSWFIEKDRKGGRVLQFRRKQE